MYLSANLLEELGGRVGDRGHEVRQREVRLGVEARAPLLVERSELEQII